MKVLGSNLPTCFPPIKNDYYCYLTRNRENNMIGQGLYQCGTLVKGEIDIQSTRINQIGIVVIRIS